MPHEIRDLSRTVAFYFNNANNKNNMHNANNMYNANNRIEKMQIIVLLGHSK